MSNAEPRQRTVIQPEGPDFRSWLVDLWIYRDVLGMLAMRDIRLRYRQTALGVLWVVLQPLASGAIFAIIFGHFARLPSDGQPYLLFVLAALLPWQLFAATAQRASVTLIGESRLVTKVYFPRILMPCAAAGSALIDYLVSLLVLAGAMLLVGAKPHVALMLLPVSALMALLLGLGVGIWLAALNSRYRDFAHATPFLLQVWLYASPVVYGATVVPTEWRVAFFANPMAGILELGRLSVLPGIALPVEAIAWSCAAALAAFASGALLFRRLERNLADKL